MTFTLSPMNALVRGYTALTLQHQVAKAPAVKFSADATPARRSFNIPDVDPKSFPGRMGIHLYGHPSVMKAGGAEYPIYISMDSLINVRRVPELIIDGFRHFMQVQDVKELTNLAHIIPIIPDPKSRAAIIREFSKLIHTDAGQPGGPTVYMRHKLKGVYDEHIHLYLEAAAETLPGKALRTAVLQDIARDKALDATP